VGSLRPAPYPTSCGFSFIDHDNNYRGIEWIDVAKKHVVCIESAMRQQNFPLYLGDLFRELLVVLVYDKPIGYLKTGGGAVSPRLVEGRVKDYENWHQRAGCHFGGTSVNVSLRLGPKV
jgi:hypothetical protein